MDIRMVFHLGRQLPFFPIGEFPPYLCFTFLVWIGPFLSTMRDKFKKTSMEFFELRQTFGHVVDVIRSGIVCCIRIAFQCELL